MIKNLLKRLRFYIFPKSISDQEFLKVCFHRHFNFQSKTELKEHFLKNKDVKNFNNLGLKKIIDRSNSSSLNSILNAANSISNRTFTVLGAQYTFNYNIPWHTDVKNEYTWQKNQYFKNIPRPFNMADIKFPWELSRGQWLISLSQAYLLTHEKKYADKMIFLISDWIDANKPESGVNWNSSMEVAIRACNWIQSMQYIDNFKDFPEEFLIILTKSIHTHGKHIYSNLETFGKLTANHYLANLAGLIYIATLFPEFKDSQNWKSFALNEIKKEMARQVLSDGCDFEASTAYHRYALELFFYPTLLCVINHKEFNGDNHPDIAKKIFGEEYVDKLLKMFEMILYIIKPNGCIPQIGDNDSGQLFKFVPREPLDVRYLLTIGSLFFKDEKFKIKEFGFCEEALWIFGTQAIEKWNRLSEHSLSRIKSRSFKEAKWYCMRNNNDYVFISNGRNGVTGIGGHTHNDKLSFELHLDGKDIIIDPGTYVYTASVKWRNYFRSTVGHNTVAIDQEEQNSFPPGNDRLFYINNDAQTKTIEFLSKIDHDIFIGEHYGYTRLVSPVTHRRKIEVTKKGKAELHISDYFEGKGEHQLEWNLHFRSPEACHSVKIESDLLDWTEEKSYYSPQYGQMVETVKLVSKKSVKLPCEFSFYIRPK